MTEKANSSARLERAVKIKLHLNNVSSDNFVNAVRGTRGFGVSALFMAILPKKSLQKAVLGLSVSALASAGLYGRFGTLHFSAPVFCEYDFDRSSCGYVPLPSGVWLSIDNFLKKLKFLKQITRFSGAAGLLNSLRHMKSLERSLCRVIPSHPAVAAVSARAEQLQYRFCRSGLCPDERCHGMSNSEVACHPYAPYSWR